MALFNPEVSKNLGDNYTGYSQGRKSNNALGELFEGLGKTLSAHVDQTEQNTQYEMGKEADDLVNAVGEDVIGGDAAEVGGKLFEDTKPTEKVGGSDGRDIPREVTSSGMTLASLKRAHEQGKLSDLYYNTQLAKISKTLRNKYPGYREVVDDLIANASGTSTANKLRNELNAKLKEEEASKSAEETRRFNLMKENEEILADPVAMELYKKAAGRTFDPNDFDMQAFMYVTGVRKFETADINRRKGRLELLSKEKEVQKEEAKKVATLEMAKLRDDILFTSLNSDGASERLQFSKLQEMIDKGLENDSKLDPDEQAAVLTLMNRMQLELGTRAEAMLTGFDKDGRTYAEYLDVKDRDEVKKVLFQPLDQIKEMLTGGKEVNIGMLNAVKLDTEARKNQIENDTLKKNGSMLNDLKVLKEMYGGEAVEGVMRKLQSDPSMNGMSSEEKAIANKLSTTVLTGESLSETLELGVANGAKSSAGKVAVKSATDLLMSPELSKEKAQKLAKSLYSLKERNNIEKFGSSNPEALFNQFVNPEITEKLKGTEAFKDYSSWAYAQGGALMKKYGQTMLNTQKYNDTLGVTFDPATKRFTYKNESTILGDVAKGPAFTGYDKYAAEEGAKAVLSMNRHLDRMQGIILESGDTEESFLSTFFMGEDFNKIAKEGSLLTRMKDQFFSVWEASQEAGKKVPDSQNAPPPLGDPGALEAPKDRILEDYIKDSQSKLDIDSADDFLTSVSDKPRSAIEGLDDSFSTNLASLLQAAPPEIRSKLGVYSARRSSQRQKELWAGALKKYGSAARARKWVAPPGRSRHESGLAADLSYNGASLSEAPASVVRWLHNNAGQYGLHFPLGNENWHIELEGSRKKKKQVASK